MVSRPDLRLLRKSDTRVFSLTLHVPYWVSLRNLLRRVAGHAFQYKVVVLDIFVYVPTACCCVPRILQFSCPIDPADSLILQQAVAMARAVALLTFVPLLMTLLECHSRVQLCHADTFLQAFAERVQSVLSIMESSQPRLPPMTTYLQHQSPAQMIQTGSVGRWPQ